MRWLPAIAAVLCLVAASPRLSAQPEIPPESLSAMPEVPLEKQVGGNPTLQLPKSKQNKDLGISVQGDLNENQQYREVFRLVLGRNEAVVLDLQSSVFDAKLQVFSAAGERLAEDDDSGDDGRSSRLTFAPPGGNAGTFYVVASSADNRDGRFTLNATPRRAPPQASVREIVAGQEIKGRFDSASAFNLDRQKMYVRHWFEAAPGERILIEARSTTVNLELLVLKDGQQEIEGATSSKGASLYYPAAAAGRHFVEVLAKSDSSGDYTLLLKRLPLPSSITAPKPLLFDEPVQGAFTEDSSTPSPDSNRPQAFFLLEGAAGESVVLVAKVDSTDGSVGYNASPVTLSAGADTPLGFAEVQKATSEADADTARMTVKFTRGGALLVRLLGRSGAITGYTLVASRVAPKDSPALSNSEPN